MKLDRRHLRRHKIIQVRICLVGVFLAQTIIILNLAFKAPDVSKKSGGNEKPEVSYSEKLTDPVAIFTLFLVISTVLLWRSTERLAALASRQARDTAEALRLSEISARAAERGAAIARDALVASNRAWIRVGFVERPIVNMLDGAIHVKTKLSIQNIGSGPALNVWPSFWLYSDKDSSIYLVPFGEQCEIIRTMPKKEIAIGHVLFPGQKHAEAEIPNSYFSSSIDREDVEAGIIYGRGFKQEHALVIRVLCCVNYFLPTDDKAHQTRITANLIQGSNAGWINPSDFGLHNTTLDLDHIFGSSASAD